MTAGAWHYLDRFDGQAIAILTDTCHARGMVAMVPEAEKACVPILQQWCREHGIALAGAIFPRILAGDSLKDSGLLLLPMHDRPHFLLSGPLQTSDAIDATIEGLERLVPAKGDKNGSLCLLFDALMPDIATFLHHCYRKLADRVAYLGGNAGSETFEPMPCLFDSTRIEQGGLLALLLPHCQDGWLEHGFRLPEQMTTATAAEGNRIISIDWRPAFEVYRELAKRDYGIEITHDNFYEMAVHYPFGIVRANGEIVVRIPVALRDDGSLHCVGEIPPNSLLTLLEGPEETLIEGVHTLGKRIGKPQSGITFYCAGRRMHLGEAAVQNELTTLQQSAGDLYGALTLGEIGSASGSGYPVLHNACLLFSPCQLRDSDAA